MVFVTTEACLEHNPGPLHPDRAERITAIERHLRNSHRIERVTRPDVGERAARAVHDQDYVESVRQFCESGGGRWDADTGASAETWHAALTYVGVATWVAERALTCSDDDRPAFGFGRPPGHHARTDDAGGFCFFNNAAAAAEHALNAEADSVAILDWDAHHGDGTQEIFIDRNDVLFISVHQADLYPPTGSVSETGWGEGQGATVNIPLPGGASDADFRFAFEEVIVPVLRRYEPDLLLVSAGFDAHQGDPISNLQLSTEGFGLLAEIVQDVVTAIGAGIGFVLEGGYYDLDALSTSVEIVHDSFDDHNLSPDYGVIRRGTWAAVDELRESVC